MSANVKPETFTTEMTVGELIERLSKFPPDTQIFIWDTYSGDRLDIAHELDPWTDSNGVTIVDLNTVCDSIQ